jgi:hypothetical protein
MVHLTEKIIFSFRRGDLSFNARFREKALPNI